MRLGRYKWDKDGGGNDIIIVRQSFLGFILGKSMIIMNVHKSELKSKR